MNRKRVVSDEAKYVLDFLDTTMYQIVNKLRRYKNHPFLLPLPSRTSTDKLQSWFSVINYMKSTETKQNRFLKLNYNEKFYYLTDLFYKEANV